MSLTKQDLRSIESIVDNRIRRTEVLLEDMDDKFIGLLDAVSLINERIRVLPKMKDNLEEVKTNVKAIKAVLSNHETRITKLESTTQ